MSSRKIAQPINKATNVVETVSSMNNVGQNSKTASEKSSDKNESASHLTEKRKCGLNSKTINLIKQIQAAKRQEYESQQLNEQENPSVHTSIQSASKTKDPQLKCQQEAIVQSQRASKVIVKSTDEPKPGKKRILYPDKIKSKASTCPPNLSTEQHTALNEFSCSQSKQADEVIDEWEQLYDESDKQSDLSKTIEQIDKSAKIIKTIRHETNSPLNTKIRPVETRLRSPVICVLGHVNAGKTTILDNLRETNVQKNEAGGITQQIGATNLPLETIFEHRIACQKIFASKKPKIPGVLVIDTPGHETFKNLRSRGSSLCDLVVLVVDIFHGLEAQTIESIQLLIERQTPFLIALNKIDLIYDWQKNPQENIDILLEEQSEVCKNQFDKLCNEIIVQFAIQNLNVALFYKNLNRQEFYSMVPVSARSGDGLNSLIAEIIRTSQTELASRLEYTDKFEATVMEVKTVGGLGTTIDVVLINGHLSNGDKIVLATQDGPIVTKIRGLLIPASSEELRVTNEFEYVEKVTGACSFRIVAKDLNRAIAGLPLFLIQNNDDKTKIINDLEHAIQETFSSFDLKERGVYVQASTLGSLEAFLELLKQSNIPCSGVNIGPVHRKDVMRALAQADKDIELAVILAFDVSVDKDILNYATNIGVNIFQDDEIYRLKKKFLEHQEKFEQERREKYRDLAVFPCRLRILPEFVFNRRDPLVCGVLVEDGILKLGTPICIPTRQFIDLGRVISIEQNHKALTMAKKDSKVCVKIEFIGSDTPKMYGRDFDDHDLLVSKISRSSFDVMEKYFHQEMKQSDWLLTLQLNEQFVAASDQC